MMTQPEGHPGHPPDTPDTSRLGLPSLSLLLG